MILAVDIGTASCGWAVVRPRTGRVVDLGVIMQPHDSTVDVQESRRLRIREQARELREVAERHACRYLAAEDLSFGGPPKARLAMGVSQALCWGSLEAIGVFLDLEVRAIPPKTWQRAVVPEAGAKIRYEDVYDRLHAFVGDLPALHRINPSERNHALDGAGVGVYAALRYFAARA